MLTEPMAPPRPNHYGAMAQEHMARYLPARYAQIADPTSYFTDLGEAVADAIEALTEELAEAEQARRASTSASATTGETYPERVGRMNMARLMAEEAALAEMVFLAPEADPPDAPTDETGAFIGADPGMGRGWTPLWSTEADSQD